MRTHLQFIKQTLKLHWNYSAITTFDKSLAYQEVLYTSHSCERALAPMHDLRNFSMSWFLLKTHLTPLATIEKKTISGFDHRLVTIKGSRKLKQLRRNKLTTYADVIPSRLYGMPCNKLKLFVSSGCGWGSKSSQSLLFLKGKALKTFRKKKHVTFLCESYFPLPHLVSKSYEFQINFSRDDVEAQYEENFIMAVALNSDLLTTLEKTFLETKAEMPNLVSMAPSSQINVTDAAVHCKYLAWISGAKLQTKLLHHVQINTKAHAFKKEVYRNIVCYGWLWPYLKNDE